MRPRKPKNGGYRKSSSIEARLIATRNALPATTTSKVSSSAVRTATTTAASFSTVTTWEKCRRGWKSTSVSQRSRLSRGWQRGEAMRKTKKSKTAEIRARLGHPVIDSDGHSIEPIPVFLEYLKSVAGSRVADSFRTALHDSIIDPRWSSFSIEERRARRNLKPTWWANAGNTRDLATAVLPELMYERLEELGLDY